MKLKKFITCGMLCVLIIVTIVGCKHNNNQQIITRTEFLMDTVITLKIYDKQDEEILDKAINRLKEIESRMSRTIKDSDISLINKNAGIRPVQIHDDVYYVIEQAKDFAVKTDGAYEPTIGPLVDLWNVTGTTQKERDSIPTEEQINENLALVNYNDLELMDDNYVFLKRKGMKLDIGGIVKGYAADEIKRIFKENEVTSAIIDLGGNIYVLGEKENGDSWNIGIQEPVEATSDYLGVLKVKNKSVVTSGDYERYFMYQGKKYHHIIDSKTGYPADSKVAGVSIISENSIDGDALSTTLFVLGIEEGTKLINQLQEIDAIFITKNHKVFISEELMNIFDLTNKEYKLINNTN